MLSKKFIILLLFFLFSVLGTLNAENNDLNGTNFNLEDTQTIGDTQTNNLSFHKPVIIDDDSYHDYFDGSGYILENKIKEGDLIKIANVSNKSFKIDIPLNITSSSESDIIINSHFEIKNTKNLNIYGLKIKNTDSSPFFIDFVDNCNIFNNTILINSSLTKESLDYDIFGINSIDLYNSSIYNNNINVYSKFKSYGINLDFAYNVTVKNNNISVSGIEKGIFWGTSGGLVKYASLSLAVQNSINVKILNNKILHYILINPGNSPISSGYSTSFNVLFFKSRNTLFDFNYIYTEGYNYVYGLHLESNDDDSSMYNNITNNIFYTRSDYFANAIQLGVGNKYSYIFNNTLICNSTNMTYGINVLTIGGSSSPSNNEIINNSINCFSYFNQGIQLYSSNNNSIKGNNILAEGSISLGISLGGSSYNNEISYNNINTKGDNSKPLRGDYVDDVDLENGGIKIKGRNQGASNNIISFNNIVTDGNHTIILTASSNDNIIENNNLKANSLGGDESIIDKVGNNLISNNFIRNNIQNSSDSNKNENNQTKDVKTDNTESSTNSSQFNHSTLDEFKSNNFEYINSSELKHIDSYNYELTNNSNTNFISEISNFLNIGDAISEMISSNEVMSSPSQNVKYYELEKDKPTKNIMDNTIFKLVGLFTFVLIAIFILLVYYRKNTLKE
ncbi:MAG: hypothetical protein KO202_03590 [Methanobacteriaceae archaeon]|jgi:hypothetical protein|nr:hypothetical protein [Methanobacteriaceae archaeon]